MKKSKLISVVLEEQKKKVNCATSFLTNFCLEMATKTTFKFRVGTEEQKQTRFSVVLEVQKQES